jgi:hypothetical protein
MRHLLALSFSLLAACEKAPPIPETCSKAGDKCQLPSGPLGICDSVPCKTGQPGPCLKCMSQH